MRGVLLIEDRLDVFVQWRQKSEAKASEAHARKVRESETQESQTRWRKATRRLTGLRRSAKIEGNSVIAEANEYIDHTNIASVIRMFL